MNDTCVAYRAKEGFSEEIPDRVGLWLMVCGENSNIAEHIAITNKGKTLIVHDESLGTNYLRHYHDNLTRPMWKFIA